jgi:asparagine synthase (glutamine-hydrolysing)
MGVAVFRLPDRAEARTTSWTQQGSQLCIFTGYLYNGEELTRELALDGRALSQAEVVLEAWRRWGEGVPGRLEGSFSFAVWDQTADTLLCARDIWGMHPLFYAETSEELVLSWDMETVRGHPGVSREFDPVTLAEHLTHHLVEPEETFFRAIRRVPGGCSLRLVRGRRQVSRYWEPLSAPVQWVTAEESKQFPERFRKAVESVMRCGGGRAGIFLSGGLDSVSVAAFASDVAAEYGWPAPQAYSVDFPGVDSEEPLQRAVAGALGFPQTFTYMKDYVGQPGLLRRVLDWGANFPSPPTFVFAPAYLDLMQQAKVQGCGVMLTGDGGDEMLIVTPAYVADLLRDRDWAAIRRELTTLIRSWDGSIFASFRTALWTWGLRALIRDWVWRRKPEIAMRRRRQLLHRAYPPWVAPDPSLRKSLVQRFEEKWDRASIQESAYLTRIHGFLTDPGMNIVFEEQFYRSTLAGLPALHPYRARSLATFLLRTPPELLNRGGRSKSMVRQTLHERFPQLGFLQQRKPTGDGFAKELFPRELPYLWQCLGAPRQMAEAGLIQPDQYATMLSRYQASSKMARQYEVWHGASIEQWMRDHA